MNGSLSRSAPLTSALLPREKRSIFTANQPSWLHNVCAELKMQMQRSGTARPRYWNFALQ
jgi:hypothetical protein